MADYRRMDDLTVTCGLTACTPGSAPRAQRSISSMRTPLPLRFTVVVVVTDYTADGYGVTNLGYVGPAPASGQVLYIR